MRNTLTAIVLVAALAASPLAAADAEVDPEAPGPPPQPTVPPTQPAPSELAGWALGTAFEEGRWALVAAFFVGGQGLEEAFDVGGCTLENVFLGNCAYVVVADESGDAFYASAGQSPADTGIWQETNGCEGLQRSAVDCDADPATEPADDRVL